MGEMFGSGRMLGSLSATLWLVYDNVIVFCMGTNFNVSSYINNMRDWDWPGLDNILPISFIPKIRCIMQPNKVPSPDRFSWTLPTNGTFSIKSTYNYCARNNIQ